MSIQAEVNADPDTLDAVTGEGGPLAAGVLPALDVVQPEGAKAVWQAAGGGSVSKIKPPKNDRNKDEKAERVTPKTIFE